MTVGQYVAEVIRCDGYGNGSFPYKDAKFLSNVVDTLCNMDRVDLAFEIAEGLYWFCNDWHGGQSSELYAVLSCLDYAPAWSEISPADDTDSGERFNAREVYQSLCRWYGYGSETIG